MQEMVILKTEVENQAGSGKNLRPFPEESGDKQETSYIKDSGFDAERQDLVSKRRPIVICRPGDRFHTASFSTDDIVRNPKTAPKTALKEEIPSDAAREIIDDAPRPAAEYGGGEAREAIPIMPKPAASNAGSVRRIPSLILSAALLVGLIIAYPKICPQLDKFSAAVVRAFSVFGENVEDTDLVHDQESEKMPENTEDTEDIERSGPLQEDQSDDASSSKETVNQEDFNGAESVSQSEESVIGTIDNMSGEGVVSVQTFSAAPGGIYLPLAQGLVKNATELSNSKLQKAAQAGVAFTLTDTDAPQVLIMHTHTTESYLSAQSASYDTDFSFRTRDNTQNMVRIGDAIAEALQERGIGVLHDVTQHDYPSYTGSYERSAETVKKYLEQYPSIRIVLDIHRDAIGSDGEIIAPTTTINGKEAAQLMIISGCDDGTMDMPHYLDNFAFAAALEEKLEQLYPTLTRPLLFDYRKYNQDLTTGSLLIEVGSNANTLAQAVYSGTLLGNALAEFCLEEIAQSGE